MKSERRSMWLRIVAEGVAIVVSILLAFAIQAWWDGRRDRAEERVALMGLRQEFEKNLAQLDATMAFHEEGVLMSERLLSLSRADSPDSNPVAMDSLVRRGWIDYGTFNPSQGLLSALVASGDIRLIRNTQLREAIGAWSGMLDDLVEDELIIARDSQERWTPAIHARVPMDYVYALASGRVAEGDRPDYRVLLGDTLLENYLLQRIDNTEYVLRRGAELRVLIEEILDLADGSLR